MINLLPKTTNHPTNFSLETVLIVAPFDVKAYVSESSKRVIFDNIIQSQQPYKLEDCNPLYLTFENISNNFPRAISFHDRENHLSCGKGKQNLFMWDEYSSQLQFFRLSKNT